MINSGKKQNRLKFKIDFTKDEEETKPITQQGTIVKEQKPFEQQYVLEGILGEGAHAVVRAGYRKATRSQPEQKKVAVKIFRSGDAEIINTIKRTYNNTRFLNHSNIAQNYELFINEKTGTSYLVMEYCSYQSLESYLKKKKCLEEIEIKMIAKELLESVKYIHQKGICHRDIKPDNILINEQYFTDQKDCCVKLIDFGVSKRFINIVPGKVGSVTQNMWTKTGNLYYCAPEIFINSQYTMQIDLWAVGVVLYQCLTGELPFCEDSDKETIEQIIDENNKYHFEHPLFNRSSQNCRDLIRRLLKVSPQERIVAEDALDHIFLNDIQGIDVKQSRDDTNLSFAFQKSPNSQHLTQSSQMPQFWFGGKQKSKESPLCSKDFNLEPDCVQEQKFQDKIKSFKEDNQLQTIQVLKKPENYNLNTIDLISSYNTYNSVSSVQLQQQNQQNKSDLDILKEIDSQLDLNMETSQQIDISKQSSMIFNVDSLGFEITEEEVE